MKVDRVRGILVYLQRRNWTDATSQVEDRRVDTWLSQCRRRETVAGEYLDVWTVAS